MENQRNNDTEKEESKESESGGLFKYFQPAQLKPEAKNGSSRLEVEDALERQIAFPEKFRAITSFNVFPEVNQNSSIFSTAFLIKMLN